MFVLLKSCKKLINRLKQKNFRLTLENKNTPFYLKPSRNDDLPLLLPK